ncbi:SHOCT domain-containing protein [Acetobacterium bakii]|uniref:SHOCT domain-containing protein n=1 Tax=Acetobacterium bakii TaxID=52689 RepID=A0A0L6TZT2_9FIRM|nr:SHOCT domain-containing protein [Acetobacterium bakii]KNZ41592.1 hypothetical protein AKG39_11445 [Acetobacterium bakii]
MPGLLRGMARTAAVVGTASAVSGRVQHKQQQKYAAQDQQAYQAQMAQQQAQQTAAPTPGFDDQMAQLTQLAQLKDQGIISSAEFEAKKKQILGL